MDSHRERALLESISTTTSTYLLCGEVCNTLKICIMCTVSFNKSPLQIRYQSLILGTMDLAITLLRDI